MGGGLRPASAADINLLDGELTGSFDTTITLGVSARTADRSDEFVGVANGGDANSINADDGNLNYDQGDITSARAKATHELDLNWRNYGFFGRGNCPAGVITAGYEARGTTGYCQDRSNTGDRENPSWLGCLKHALVIGTRSAGRRG